jgi:hypothetical protein
VDLQRAYPDPFNSGEISKSASGAAKSYYEWFIWRSAIEYPELVDKENNLNLSTRNRVNPVVLDRERIGRHLKTSLKNWRYASWIMGRVCHIWRHEGINGLLNKLFRHSSRAP